MTVTISKFLALQPVTLPTHSQLSSYFVTSLTSLSSKNVKLLMHVKIALLFWEFQQLAWYHRGNSCLWDLLTSVFSDISLWGSLLVIKSLYIYKKRPAVSGNTWDFYRQSSSYEKLLFNGGIRIHITVLNFNVGLILLVLLAHDYTSSTSFIKCDHC